MVPLPAEISRDPLHHSRRGTRQGGAFGPQAPIPGGYGATDPEKSLQGARSFFFSGFDVTTKPLKNHLAK